ncbi:hypothetical protein [Halomonas organivorans]|uniref:Uncharacterized protein n=1 Tax=Halomonas organivorans TaxID=257772 RepID=A0A7W5C081_9GAMM|nr:hypothetical protein [Halomonas organivorans]MBB3142231.1 hypothetical protein [Halomonas organivorans]
MNQPTHTHKFQGGRFALITETPGTGPLQGQTLVVYHDLTKDVQGATTLEDWRKQWRQVAADDCTVCMGTGTDQIKGNKAAPCGGCLGLGKVRQDGETPEDRWQVADVALGIIRRQARIIEQRDQVLAFPEVQKALQARKAKKEKEPPDWVQREQEWRDGGGRGHGGRRHTGD